MMLRIQICCGPDNMIYNSIIKWPGSVNDARIFDESSLKKLMEGGISKYQKQSNIITFQ